MTARPTDDSDLTAPPLGELTVSQLGEFGLIDRLARLLHGSGRDPLQPEAAGEIGIGDDAAMWEPTPGRREVLTTDALIEDVHFRHRTTSWRDLGWKALAQNVSDIAAMGALPTRAFVTLGLRADTRVADLEELYRGMADLQGGIDRTWPFRIEGGDTVSSPFTMVSITVVGELEGEGLRRAAGQPGDLLVVTGALGGSAGGLALLERGETSPGDPEGQALIEMHRRPEPRVREGYHLARRGVRCGMDLSDGLLGDAGKLAYASGLSAVLELDKLPVPAALVSRFGPNAARTMALVGGEDYELLVAIPSARHTAAIYPLVEFAMSRPTTVGRLEAGPPGQVTVLDEHGQPVTPPRSSWDHFRQSETRS
jgi:thiamine-monophosphate kinase